MRRRDFIKAIAVSAAAWPLAARAQQPERVRRIGMLMNTVADDPQGQARIVAFQQTLQQLGWIEGRNVQIDVRWGGNDVERARRYAAELVALAPSVIMAAGTLGVSALQRHGNAIPIVFVNVADPVGAGFVNNLAPRRQRYRLYELRIQHGRKMAGTSQTDRSATRTSSRPSGFNESCRYRDVRSYPRHRIFARG